MDKKLTWLDYLKPENIKNYIQGNFNKLLEDSSFFTLDQHIREQALYRAELCKPCLDNGSCFLCGCSTPNLFFAPGKEDADGKWSFMLSAESWEQFKKEKEDEIKRQVIQNEGGSAVSESSGD